MVSNEGLRFDLRVVPPESYGSLLQHFTGSKDHNVALREDAVRRGLSLSEYGVTDGRDGRGAHVRRRGGRSTRGSATQWIPPELRENLGELDAARRGELPELVGYGDLRGDLHSHSTWSSDGKTTIEEMALAARARGYEYLALTDHSHYLRDGRLERQCGGDRRRSTSGSRRSGSCAGSRRTSPPPARSTSRRSCSPGSTG